MSPSFQNWLASRNLDQQQWLPELRAMLRLRYEAATSTQLIAPKKDDGPIGPSTRLIIDGRGCQWPQRAYRVEAQL